MGKRFIIPPFTFEHMGSPPIQPAIMFVDYAHPPIIKGKYFDANAARGTAKAKDQARARVKQERRGQGIRKMTIYPTTLELPEIDEFHLAFAFIDLRQFPTVHAWLFDRQTTVALFLAYSEIIEPMPESEFIGRD